ncbi:hypothetical protein [Mycolicibacterium sp. 120270]|uniref:hypothetical protein n=1 Tax=Mycolicibacterium sp. 120270 TaxID=3090600 RepID=UPI00299F4019|nr:hypothetical protein [Mycolicibacterium sp. 120270]MDX1882713.1 hypothetical protein [Mycolicibacterium sp. 120270]
MNSDLRDAALSTQDVVQMTDPSAEQASGKSDDDLRQHSDVDAKYIHRLTGEDLDRAATAAADVDDPAIMDGAWR